MSATDYASEAAQEKTHQAKKEYHKQLAQDDNKPITERAAEAMRALGEGVQETYHAAMKEWNKPSTEGSVTGYASEAMQEKTHEAKKEFHKQEAQNSYKPMTERAEDAAKVVQEGAKEMYHGAAKEWNKPYDGSATNYASEAMQEKTHEAKKEFHKQEAQNSNKPMTERAEDAAKVVQEGAKEMYHGAAKEWNKPSIE